jgi:extracellular factor (EF) 3-hydroxypalmitic acid methyl ester biosynthesis protein
MGLSIKRQINKSALSRVYGKDRAADLSKAKAILDQFYEAAMSDSVASAVLATMQYVEQYRRTMTSDWTGFVQDICQPHPLFKLFQQDPMTRRCFEKPRGYAGDAVMLDFIYDRKTGIQIDHTNVVGQEVFQAVVTVPTCGSVNYRRYVIAKAIDESAVTKTRPINILSLACGHARELELSKALANGKVNKVIACDQDETSLQMVRERYSNAPVEAKKLTVKDFVGSRGAIQEIGTFDMVYSMGLYDYLEERLATRLTQKLFEYVAPGGRLLIANFHADNYATGYMEAFMDWKLIYRTDKEMRALAMEIDKSQIAKIKQFKDPFGNVAYLQIERKA